MFFLCETATTGGPGVPESRAEAVEQGFLNGRIAVSPLRTGFVPGEVSAAEYF